MNRVLNKDFVKGSYTNSTLITFSGVFRPASGMQNCQVRDSGVSFQALPKVPETQLPYRASRQGESDEE